MAARRGNPGDVTLGTRDSVHFAHVSGQMTREGVGYIPEFQMLLVPTICAAACVMILRAVKKGCGERMR